MVNLRRCTPEEVALIKFYKKETTHSIRKIANGMLEKVHLLFAGF